MNATAHEPDRAPVECVITVGEVEITDLYPYLRSVEVQMSRRAATTCTMIFDTFRNEDGEWLVEDQGPFVPWKKLNVEAHFADHTENVMTGYVREVKADHPPNMSASSVTVTGQDDSILLDREHVRKTWSTEREQMTDGRIATEIAQDKGLTAETDDGLENTSLEQDETYIEFLKKRAEANGFELFFRDEKLYFHTPRLDADPQPTILVYAGFSTNCLSFQTKFDGHKPDRVRIVRAADTGTDPEAEVFEPNLPLLGSTAVNSASTDLPSFEWSMNRPSGATRAEVDARAQAAANKNAWKIEATGELDGALYGHVLLTHETVEVDGVGSTLGGKYYADEVTHVFSLDGYRQRFKLLRNATGQQP